MSALTDRDTNLQQPSRPANSVAGEENKPQESQQHKQVLEQKSADGNGKQGAYISPSDAILSPASQKLAGFKQKQIAKSGSKDRASRTLFARTPSSCSSGFADLNAEIEKQ